MSETTQTRPAIISVCGGVAEQIAGPPAIIIDFDNLSDKDETIETLREYEQMLEELVSESPQPDQASLRWALESVRGYIEDHPDYTP